MSDPSPMEPMLLCKNLGVLDVVSCLSGARIAARKFAKAVTELKLMLMDISGTLCMFVAQKCMVWLPQGISLLISNHSSFGQYQ